MKVLRIINRFNLGGITYNVSYLSKYMAPEFETMLIGGPHEESEESSLYIPRGLGLDPIIIPEMCRSINPLQDRKAYQHIRNIIREFKPDIVHTHASKAGALGRKAAFDCKVPIVVHTFHGHVFHSYFGKWKTALVKNIERRLASRSDAIIAISEKQKIELTAEHHICPPEKVHVIPLGFDLDRFRERMDEKRKSFRQEYAVADDEIAIAIIGRIVPVKNHEMFLAGLKQLLSSSDKKIRAFIIGDGESRFDLEMKAREMGFDPATEKMNVVRPLMFTSWIRDIDCALAGIDLVCLTSWNEGTPVSIIEAQAAGKPVISTRVGGVENVVSEGTSALLVDPGDNHAFFKALLELTANESLRSSMSRAGWELVGHKFSYQRLVADMKRLYYDLSA